VRLGHDGVQQPPSPRLPWLLYEDVEFGFEGGGVGGDVSWFGTHAGAEGETLATALRRQSEWRWRPVAVA
jgi:hypothetical protein